MIRRDLIVRRWDDLLRVAGSLKRGWVTASLLISRLQSYRRQNALTRALQEYGRLVKTIFILRYLESEQLRRRINTQLNKGESLHSLREFLFFANRGKIRRKQEEEQVHQATCLNLLTNCVIAWNTVYMAAAIDRLRIDGHPVQEADLAHLSPCRYEHINPYGKYAFEVSEDLGGAALRPLRSGAIPGLATFYVHLLREGQDRRPGMDRLRSILAGEAVDVLLVFATNRLFRKTYKALQFVEEEVVGRGIRCLFVKSGVDTADQNRWRMLLQIHAMTDEFVVGMYADNIRAAHEGLFDGGLVFGTITFGYLGREIPGRQNQAPATPPRPRGRSRRAAWVEQAFRWFVEDR